MSPSEGKKFCTLCGEPLEIEYCFCPSCGAIIVSNNIKNERVSEKNPKLFGNKTKSQKSDSRSIDNSKGQKVIKEQLNKKVLSKTKFFYIFSSLILLGFIIIYSSGVFDGPSITQSLNNQNNFSGQQSGVDLNNLEQISALEEIVRNNPNNNAKLLELAHLLNDSGLKEKAIEKYKQYLKINPKESDVLVDMGVCYYELGKNDDAIMWMKEALKYQPNHQIAHLNLGVVSMTIGKLDKAMEWWKKAVALDPNSNIGKRAQELINSH